jgi:hypothetical protein
MNLFRYVLLAATLVVLRYELYMSATEGVGNNYLLWYWLSVIVLGLNVVYLLRCPPGIPKSRSRLRTLFNLWLDAKERESRDRARQKD